jgi:hypothetical protein
VTTIVTTQSELDRALADGADDIAIRSERGVWLEVAGSATVYAYGSATVHAYDSATVRAYGSATVHASDSATVHASSHVAVHLHSGRARVDGGHLIDHTTVNQHDPGSWCDYHGVTTAEVDGIAVATLYKAVRDDLRSAHGFAYPIGETVACDDWRDDGDCGHGLHASPHPHLAADYDSHATRYLEVQVALAELRPLPGAGAAKCKMPRLTVVAEVDQHARPLATAEVAT